MCVCAWARENGSRSTGSEAEQGEATDVSSVQYTSHRNRARHNDRRLARCLGCTCSRLFDVFHLPNGEREEKGKNWRRATREREREAIRKTPKSGKDRVEEKNREKEQNKANAHADEELDAVIVWNGRWDKT